MRYLITASVHIYDKKLFDYIRNLEFFSLLFHDDYIGNISHAIVMLDGMPDNEEKEMLYNYLCHAKNAGAIFIHLYTYENT